jgi:hypothetical protein
MEFYCEDLPQYGVVLIPPSSAEYDAFVEDIQRRIDHAVEDRETSAVLVNRSENAIAATQVVWTLEQESGRTYTSFIGGGYRTLLHPFGIPENLLKINGYWNVILPGSKRYLNSDGDQVGDNRDVRPRAPDEVWAGGGVGLGGRGNRYRGPMKKVTLALDGVFFVDGGFAGPNRGKLWVAKIAREGHDRGIAPEKILSGIEQVTGPAERGAGLLPLKRIARGRRTFASCEKPGRRNRLPHRLIGDHLVG